MSIAGPLFVTINDQEICRGCGRVYENSSAFEEDHRMRCRSQRAFEAMREVYFALYYGAIALSQHALEHVPKLEAQLADLVTAITGPCGAAYVWQGRTVICQMAPGHDHIGRAPTFNHRGYDEKYGEIYWERNATGLEDAEEK